MTDEQYPVTVAVRRPDGSTEQVRVGTAVRSGEGFQLSLGELSIGAEADPPSRGRGAPPSRAPGGMVFPPYGRSKGQPVVGAAISDLEFYANGCRRTLDDPGKSRWHEKERVLLAAIEAELARQGVGGSPGAGSERSPFDDDFGGPPPDDDDIPF